MKRRLIKEMTKVKLTEGLAKTELIEKVNR